MTPLTIPYLIAALILGLFVGYQVCKLRYQPKLLMNAVSVLCDLLSGTITAEEAKKKYREIYPGD